jgi:signal transduction histidine kinase
VHDNGADWENTARFRRTALLYSAALVLVATMLRALFVDPDAFRGARILPQIAWVAMLAAFGLASPHCGPRAGGALAVVASVASAALQTLNMHLQRAFAGDTFPWTYATTVALPVVGAAVFREDLRAAVAISVATLAGGLLAAALAHRPPGVMAMVGLQLGLVGGLTVILARTHRRHHEAALAAARDRAEAELQRENAARTTRELRARDEFLSLVAHELRTPLTPLALVTAKLEKLSGSSSGRPTHEQDALTRSVAQLKASVRRLEGLVEQLVAFNAALAGTLALHPEPRDLAAVVRQVFQQFADDARRAATPMALEAPGRLPGTWDGALVGLALRQLIANAIEFGAGHPVDVSVRAADGTVAIAVRDRGIGIAPDDQTRIFRRFERAAPARHHGGLGVGLWMAREAARTHHGDVTVESAPGRGSTFTLTVASG